MGIERKRFKMKPGSLYEQRYGVRTFYFVGYEGKMAHLTYTLLGHVHGIRVPINQIVEIYDGKKMLIPTAEEQQGLRTIDGCVTCDLSDMRRQKCRLGNFPLAETYTCDYRCQEEEGGTRPFGSERHVCP